MACFPPTLGNTAMQHIGPTKTSNNNTKKKNYL